MARKHRTRKHRTTKFNEKELVILRQAVDEAEKKKSKYVSSPIIQEIILVVEKFIKKKRIHMLWRYSN